MIDKFELLIATHYLRMNGAQGFLALTSLLGIAIGVVVLIVVISVMNGISSEVQSILMNVNGHIKVESYSKDIYDYQQINDTILKIPGVDYSMPYIDSQSIINSHRKVSRGVLIRGLDFSNVMSFHTISKTFLKVDNKFIPNGIILGDKLASLLGVNIGDTVDIISPVMIQTVSGEYPTMSTLTVAGFFSTNVEEIDENYAYVSLANAQFLFKKKIDIVNGIEVFLQENTKIQDIQLNLLQKFENFIISNWYERHTTYCKAVALERQLMMIVLFMIIFISIFNMFSCMIILIREKTKEIAILRTFGASKKSIFSIFMICGLIIYILGFSIGLFCGILLTLNINTVLGYIYKIFNVKIIDIQAYDLPLVPVMIDNEAMLFVGLCALLLTILFLIFPVYKATLIEPSHALRS